MPNTPVTLDALLPARLAALVPALLPFGLDSAKEELVWETVRYWWSQDQPCTPADLPNKTPNDFKFDAPNVEPDEDSAWVRFVLTGCPAAGDLALPEVPGFTLSPSGPFKLWGCVKADSSVSAVWLKVDAHKVIPPELLVPVPEGAPGCVEIHLTAFVGKSNKTANINNWPPGFPAEVDLPPFRFAPLKHPIEKARATLGDGCMVVKWTENVAGLVRELLPTGVTVVPPGEPCDVSARVLATELRLDLPAGALGLDFALPGLGAQAGEAGALTFLLGADGRPLARTTLVMTLPQPPGAPDPTKPALTFTTALAWARPGERELLPDPRPGHSDPFAKLLLANDQPASVALFDFARPEPAAANFFKLLPAALPKMAHDAAATVPNLAGATAILEPHNPAAGMPGRSIIPPGGWTTTLLVNAQEERRLPFLEIVADDAGAQQFHQWLRLKPQGDGWLSFAVSPGQAQKLAFHSVLEFGTIKFEGEVAFDLDWPTLSLKVDHDTGIPLACGEAELGQGMKHLGLDWRMKGAALEGGKYEYFRVVTADYHYQVQMAPGAAFELAYDKISAEPLTLAVREFLLTPKGLSMAAEVSDQPVKLNGVETSFCFGGSRVEVVENAMQDFTLTGSGPLPPDLVGEAVADIALQYELEDGGLNLVAAAAELQGEQVLDCRGTRFQFLVSALGLKYVEEAGAIYLYFTLTGAAQYVLLPGDPREGALARLPALTIDLVDAPLCGHSEVLDKHVKFLVELPMPLRFSFLGAFGFELRGIGFIPCASQLGGDPAMELSGQIFFGPQEEDAEAEGEGEAGADGKADAGGKAEAGGKTDGAAKPAVPPKTETGAKPDAGAKPTVPAKTEGVAKTETSAKTGTGTKPAVPAKTDDAAKTGADGKTGATGKTEVAKTGAAGKKGGESGGDVISAKIDFHSMYIGLPGPGETMPRLFFGEIEVVLKIGEAFELNGAVAFYDEDTKQGFAGRGMIDIKGLPQLAAAFSFVRIRGDDDSPWERAWFIYIEVRKISFMIPVVKFYLREVGLGFGYRFTIASMKKVDEEESVAKLRTALVELSRTQAELADYNAWATDLEEPGEDPRWTIVLRAMISQNSASVVPLRYNDELEASLVNLFLLDAMIAFRSDLTFYLAIRGWLNTNYDEFVKNKESDKVRESPFLSGFAMLSARRKLFLLSAASNQDGYIGNHPPLPEFVKDMIKSAKVSASLLIQPGLMHFELGWPNMLSFSVGLPQTGTKILTIECRGGLIFRITNDGIVAGISFEARGQLAFKAAYDIGIAGVWVEAFVQLAFSSRVIGILPFDHLKPTLIYGAVGLELRIRLSFGFWIKLLFIKLTFQFSLDVGFTASVELGFQADPASIGIRGQGTLWIAVLGHRLQVNARVGSNELLVQKALEGTQHVLKLGLEATDDAETEEEGGEARGGLALAAGRGLGESVTFHTPQYTAFVIRPQSTAGQAGWGCVLLLPRGEYWEDNKLKIEQGFLPPPSNMDPPVEADFEVTLPGDGFTYVHWDPAGHVWKDAGNGADKSRSFRWQADWQAPAFPTDLPASDQDGQAANVESVSLADYVRQAFVQDENGPVGDPDASLFDHGEDVLEDARVYNPSDNAFEAAVRGAADQFAGSPYFRLDSNNRYDAALQAAFSPGTTVYSEDGDASASRGDGEDAAATENAFQMRGMIVQDLIAGVREYSAVLQAANVSGSGDLPAPAGPHYSLPFNLGLVFAFKGTNGALPAWLEEDAGAEKNPTVRQRGGPADNNLGEAVQATTFNTADTDFRRRPPEFTRVQHYASTNTIAITWDLAWSGRDATKGPSADPNHHLANYEVRRRELTGREREVVYTVKPAEALHREGGALLRLRPRFNVVDHWSHETVDEQAAMPAAGYSYLYAITPVDLAGNRGRPLTLVATRVPSQPPYVPASARLRVSYDYAALWAGLYGPADGASMSLPPVVVPSRIEVVDWREDGEARTGKLAAPARYYLVFRREQTLPTGSYGLDAATAAERISTRPTSHARRLPADIAVDISRHLEDGTLSLVAALQAAGVIPAAAAGPAEWRPEAWLVYIQTESIQGVRSPLVPVQLVMRVNGAPGATGGVRCDERLLPMLEWLAQPVRAEWLPPEDESAATGLAHVPMPGATGLFGGLESEIKYRVHPAYMRAVRFRWNQAPSGRPDYPADLNAGYHLYQLDADAHTDETLENKRLAALRRIQEVQMIPPDSLPLIPGDTLAVNQWEAWYPSDVARLGDWEPVPTRGGLPVRQPWHSWDDADLAWPACPPEMVQPAGDRFIRMTVLHPALQGVIDALRGSFAVDLQLYPPDMPGDLAALLETTSPRNDPYGWSVLQRFGLSVGLTVRQRYTGELVLGTDLLTAVQAAVGQVDPAFEPHLFVEVLFQPGRAVSVHATDAPADALLALVQLSLRPLIVPLPVDPAGQAEPPDPVRRLKDAGWEHFRRYVESLSGSEGPRIETPATPEAIKAWLPAYRAWAARFMEHAGLPGGAGPWLATAYPRASTPSQAAPDEAGRLSYTQIIEEQRAHNYRYYILPYSRYDVLWRKIWESPVFKGASPGKPVEPERLSMPVAFPQGGLDVVIDRVRPVERPLILRSGRLDLPVQPGAAAAPGGTWEVILARHTEQAMVERNQTLARQVGFRQVSFTLLRRFAYSEWLDELKAHARPAQAGDPFDFDRLVAPANSAADVELPASYPEQPDHLALDALNPTDRLTLGLPARIPAFGQGALALQWQGLPFYYEHRLLAVAQSSTTVSEVNEVTQRDFEYVSPGPLKDAEPLGTMTGRDLSLTIPLYTFWESLPPAAQQMWPVEKPPDTVSAPRKLSSLPDPEVVYQLILNVDGNVEVQVEYVYEKGKAFVARQLGKLVVDCDGATIVTPLDSSPGDRFKLKARLDIQPGVKMEQIELRTRRGAAAPSRRVPVRGV